MGTSNNNDCGITNDCNNCTYLSSITEREDCRQIHLRWLTQVEMDEAIAKLWTRSQEDYLKGILSDETYRLFSMDAIRAAQDAKTWSIALNHTRGGNKCQIKNSR